MLLLLQVATKNVHQSALKSSARHGDIQIDRDGYRELEGEGLWELERDRRMGWPPKMALAKCRGMELKVEKRPRRNIHVSNESIRYSLYLQ